MPQPIDVTSDFLPPRMELPLRLELARRTAGLTQEQLGLYIGVARRTIGNYEAGTTRPTRATILSWALATQTPQWWLLGEAAVDHTCRCMFCNEIVPAEDGDEPRSRCFPQDAQVASVTNIDGTPFQVPDGWSADRDRILSTPAPPVIVEP
jgi:transcriptional regulator with XRE-family HTH domain